MRVREIELEDLPEVSWLMERVGWRAFTQRGWERDWELNPSLDKDGPPISRGWVLQDDERIVGFLGNLIQRFDWEGRTLRAATVWGFVVAPEARGNSMRLLQAFSRQHNVDLLLATTATGHVPKLLGLLKFERLPVADFDVGLYWVTGTRGLIASTLRRMGAPRVLAAAGGAVLAPALWAGTRLWRRWSPAREGHGLEFDTLVPERAGEEFDALWEKKRKGDRRLALVRRAAVLRWHFAPAGWSIPPVLLTARRRGELVGYVALVRTDKEQTGLKRWQVADLLALEDEPDIVRGLVRVAYEHTVADRAYMLEVFGCPATLRPIVLEGRPRRWKKGSWPYLYKTADPALDEALRSPEAWYPTLIDGDGCLPHL